MATRNRSWIAKLFGSPKQPFAARKPYRPKPASSASSTWSPGLSSQARR